MILSELQKRRKKFCHIYLLIEKQRWPFIVFFINRSSFLSFDSTKRQRTCFCLFYLIVVSAICFLLCCRSKGWSTFGRKTIHRIASRPTMLDSPVTIRTLKLFNNGLGQHLDERLLGCARCCWHGFLF